VKQKPGPRKSGGKSSHTETEEECFIKKKQKKSLPTTTLDKLVVKSTHAQEAVCAEALINLKYQGMFYHSIPESFVVGTKLNTFLFSFVNRTLKICDTLVDLSLIQKVIWSLSSNRFPDGDLTDLLQLKEKNQMELAHFNDPASLTYFLTAARLGSLQSNDFQPHMQENHFKALEELFRPCYGEARIEVISAHLLLAFFCTAIAKRGAFTKHSGFAKVLLEALDSNVPERLKQACHFFVHGGQLPLCSTCGVDKELIKIFCYHFLISPDFFCQTFTTVAMLLDFDGKFNSNAELCDEFNSALLGMFRGSPAFTIPLMTVWSFQKACLRFSHSKDAVEKALSDIRQFIDFLLHYLELSIETLPPMVQGYIFQIECFKHLVTADFINARLLLASILDNMDFWILRTGYFLYGGVLVHQLHFLIAAAEILNLEKEYHCFWRRLDQVFYMMQQAFLLPSSLSGLHNTAHLSLCVCHTYVGECNLLTVLAAVRTLCLRENSQVDLLLERSGKPSYVSLNSECGIPKSNTLF